MSTPELEPIERRLDTAEAAFPAHQEERSGSAPFPVVGVGASAGGLDAFTQLLRHLPVDTGMAFVLIQHLDPRHESQLADLLSRATPMPVAEATEGMAVRPDHVYIIPRDTNMALAEGKLQLTPRSETRGQYLPLDHFFRSLAKDQPAPGIGVILSGTGSDGTLGLAEVKAAGGISFAQDPRSAQHAGMPQSAIASGCVDFILPPDEIARELAGIGDHPYLAPLAAQSRPAPAGDEDHFQSILAHVQAASGVDFGHYRDTTIRRRIMRRMALHRIEALEAYGRRLEEDPSEIEALYHDLLINVTSFFRDPEMFEALKSHVFPRIVEAESPEATFRVWVAGCSTGQEAYSLAISLLEFLEGKPVRPGIQIFATDLSDTVALTHARAGLYPESIEAEVSPERLRRFFTKEEGGYQVSKSIRDMCVFARQDVAADPPFSRIDLISCRNLLIYLAPLLQRRVIQTFHYALKPTGFLVLGASETVGELTDLFALADRKHKIHAKKVTAARQYPHFSAEEYSTRHPTGTPGGSRHLPNTADWQREADRLLLGQYAPPGVLVNDRLDILQFRGHTGPYLEPAPGEASLNLLKMAREGLFLAVRSAIEAAREQNAAVRWPGVRVRTGDPHGEPGQVREIDLQVIPVNLPGSHEGCLLILFEEACPPAGQEPAEASSASAPAAAAAEPSGSARQPMGLRRWLPRGWQRLSASPAAVTAAPIGPAPAAGNLPSDEREVAQLRRELDAAREYLQAVIAQEAATNEELKSANEEILSANEELQSTNEELETAKEELQSVNEELTTVNEQLQNRNQELTEISSDLTNLLSSTSIPIVMLGSDLRIRRFTAPAQKLLSLLPSDVGRPIGGVRPTVDASDLEPMIQEVIDTVQPREREVQDQDGRWYTLRIHPYRTVDQAIDGAVLAWLDIHEVKTAQQELRRARDYAQAIVETARQYLLVLDADLRVETANRAFYDAVHLSPGETEGQLIYELGAGQWNIPDLRALLEEILPADNAFTDFVVKQDIPGTGTRTMLLNARRLQRDADEPARILLAIEDITARKRLEEALRRHAEELAAADRRKDEFMAMLAHELRNPLASILNAVQLLQRLGPAEPPLVRAQEIIERQVLQQAGLLDDLLDVSRITRGKILLRPERLDLGRLVRDAMEDCRGVLQEGGLALTLELPEEPVWVEGDRMRLAQVMGNLCQNAAKFTDRGGHVTVCLDVDAAGQWAVVTVRDTGIGIEPEMLSRLFDTFTQADRSLDRSRGGLGLGLAMVKGLVERHGGEVRAESAGPGHGAAFTFLLPLASAPAAAEELPAPAGLPEGPLRILIVEDNRDTAETLRELLELSRHTVAVASSGPEALEGAQRFQPEVVICDLGLPGMDGYQVAAALRRNPATAHIRLIALTGYGLAEDERRAQEAGFDLHLTKPVNFANLERHLVRSGA